MHKYGIDNEYSDPDINNKHNYMLDTCIFNALCDDGKALDKLEISLKYKFEYFYSNIQIRELQGIKDIGIKLVKKNSPVLDKKKAKFDEIVKRLDVKKTGHMAVLSTGTWILDGSCHIISKHDKEFCHGIKKGNAKHNEDMIIAESVLRKGCILVTEDKALLKKFLKYYPDKVIGLAQLLEIIDKCR